MKKKLDEANDLAHPDVRHERVYQRLKRFGIDPDRLSVHRLGVPRHLLSRRYPPWARRMALGLFLWVAIVPLEEAGWILPDGIRALLSLVVGLLILQAACDALLTATERLAARQVWDHYVAGTVSEIVSTVPELVVIAFVVPVSPVAAMVIALVTIYNNALVFSLYSFFLPKDQKGRFLMPAAITEAGTQILIAGAAMGSVIGLVMLVLSAHEGGKSSFAVADMGLLGLVMLLIFAVYLRKLVTGYASEETAIRTALELSDTQIEQRREEVYEDVKRVSLGNIVWIFTLGVMGLFLEANEYPTLRKRLLPVSA